MAIDKNKIIEAATKFVQKGQYDKAIKEYLKLLEADPKDARIQQKLGELYQKKGENNLAADCFLKVAESYSADGFFLKAVAVYKQVLKLNPALIEVNLKLAELHQQLGLMSDAMAQYQLVANHYDKIGNTRASLDTLRKMVDLDPDNVASRIKLAELYAREQMNAEAIQEFRHSAEYLKRNNRVDDYIKVAERLVFLDPGDMALTKELANIYLAKQDTKRALAKLQLCFKADPKDVETLTMLAKAFLDLGQATKTVSVYKELAKIYDEQDKVDEERDVWRKILEIAPDDPDAKAHVAPKQAEPAPAPVAAAPAPARGAPAAVAAAGGQKATPEQINKLLTETDVYVKYGLHDKALDHLKKVFAADPESIDAHEKAAQLYTVTNDKQNLLDTLVKAVRLCIAKGETNRAKPSLQKLCELDPMHPEVQGFLEAVGGLAPVEEAAEIEEEAILVDAAEEVVEVAEEPADALPESRDIALDAADAEEQLVTDDAALDAAAAELSASDEESLIAEPPAEEELIAAPESEDLAVSSGDEDLLGTGGDDEQLLTQSVPAVTDDEPLVDEPLTGPVAAEDLAAESASSDDVVSEPVDEELVSEPVDEEFAAPVEEELLDEPVAEELATDELAAAPVEESAFGDEPGDLPTVQRDSVDPDLLSADEGDALPDNEGATRVADLNELMRQADAAQAAKKAAEEAAAKKAAEEAAAKRAEEAAARKAAEAAAKKAADEAAAAKAAAAKAPPREKTGTIERAATKAYKAPEPKGVEVKPEAPKAEAKKPEAKPAVEAKPAKAPVKPAAKPLPPPEPEPEPVAEEESEDPAGDELDEAAFFIDQGVLDEARDILETVAIAYPKSKRAKELMALLEAKERGESAPAEELPPVSANDAPSTTEAGFDLAAELGNEDFGGLDAGPQPGDEDFQYSVEDVFEEFKKGVQKVVKPEDVDTHYDLGIAYKEMGLIDDAIGEFEQAIKGGAGKKKEVECLTMIGLCRNEKGEHAEAIKAFKRGLHSEQLTPDASKALQFEIGAAYERLGDLKESLAYMAKVEKLDPKYRDVSGVVARLKQSAPAGAALGDDDEEATQLGDGGELKNGHAAAEEPKAAAPKPAGKSRKIGYV